uniref:zinc finger C2HC domain-containing protein 1B isoform X3 n=1 Tax=Ictidomys tridecemlineatus TaxID=43179 RepID=UPI001A9E0447|nr:zinc finger C2HC domain-containing protein 1B isoform X3 [Ictidomys tridecemlineatus]
MRNSMAGTEPFLADGNQELFPCEVCGRRFAADVLERHGPICRKLFNKKRKPFNSLKQRLQGTDILTVRKTTHSQHQPVRKSNWRQQHEDFINAIRSAKQCTLAIKEGRPLPPPPPPSINPGQGSGESQKRTNCYQCCGSFAAEQGPGYHKWSPNQVRIVLAHMHSHGCSFPRLEMYAGGPTVLESQETHLNHGRSS